MPTTRYERLSANTEEDGFLNTDQIEMKNEVKIDTSVNYINSRRSAKVMHLAIGTLAIISLYLLLSICLTFYQKWLLQEIKFPFTIVLYHLIIKLSMSKFARMIYKVTTGKSRVLLDFRTSLRKMAPTGVASGIDIGFSNWGLELVQISLYTMTKSTTIVFILLFAIILGLEKKSWSLVAIVVMIAGGLFMFTYKSKQFDAIGFSFLLFASFTSGIRWSFAQLIMQKSKLGLHNPIDMIYHMQPWMIISIIPFTFSLEGKRVLDVISNLSSTPYNDIILLVTKITIGAVIAFFMEISEFLVLSHTSSLTLSIAGIFKEICQLVLAVELHGDVLSLMNILGLILCLGGICCHITHKYSTLTTKKYDSDDEDITINSEGTENMMHSVSFHKKVGQSIPLLDSDDSEASINADEPNASEVIFDVLKRRDGNGR